MALAVLLPDEIVVWEILVRLPPKSLLRCRSVCRAWRHATSARRFLVAHHGRQPTLPLLQRHGSYFLDIIPFDHRIGLTAADQLHPIARLQPGSLLLDSCDGLILLRSFIGRRYAVCNPATRQYATLRQANGFTALGMYPHRPTGEYRLLLYPDRLMDGVQDGCHVLTLGSCLKPRHFGWPEEARPLIYQTNVLFRGRLHWYRQPEPEIGERGIITVFDTTAESFRQMHAPLLPPGGVDDLFQMDGMLSMSSSNYAGTVVGIWVLQDYESEIWTFKYQIRLPVEEIRAQFDKVNVTSSDDSALILVRFGKRLLQFDFDGKLVATFHNKDLCYYSLRLKQSLVLHSFFPALEGYVVNNSPFISTSQVC